MERESAQGEPRQATPSSSEPTSAIAMPSAVTTVATASGAVMNRPSRMPVTAPAVGA
jgi:hypothetical protein